MNIGQPLPILGSNVDALSNLESDASCFGLFPLKGEAKKKYAGAPEGLCTFFLSIGEAF
ncbi:hypothetical protein ACN28S_49655 [Cystobacter fuscus]